MVTCHLSFSHRGLESRHDYALSGGLSNRLAHGALTKRRVTACCDEFADEVCRFLVTKCRMLLACIVIVCPFRDGITRMIDTEEQSLIQQIAANRPAFAR